MEQEKDWYRILEIPDKANEQEIKAAYRKLVKKYHPDTHARDKNNTEKFNDISEAYRILGNTEKRREYDKRRNQDQNPENSGNTEKEQKRAKEAPDFDFQNMNKNFEEFFCFHPETKDITREDKVKMNKNPLDTTEMFERFMGIKR
ncbi:J domain-containing protein [Anaerocolumna jejuensis]|uniref:J domain-containing protein n=1 Tax=Anaerocolumna jejuensis TaxID=259063 RepID=UPI003F7BDB04